MSNSKIVKLFDKELRFQTISPGYIREETEFVVRHVSEFGEKGFIIYSNLTEQNASEVISREVDYFKARKESFEWKVYSYDKPTNLVVLLQQQGFTVEPEEALMTMEINHQHPLLLAEHQPNLQEIKDEKGINDIILLENEIWQESHDELGKRLLRDKQNDPESLFLYGIYEDGKLVSAAWMYLEYNSSFASLWGGSTLKDYRGKGYYTALLAARAKKSYQKGHRYLTVDASPMSRPILEKNGFQCIAYTYECNSPT